MSNLRRRIFGGGQDESSDSSSRDASPAPAPPEAGGDAYRIVPEETLNKLRKKVKTTKGGKKWNAWIFGLGGVFGLVMAGVFAGSNGGIDKLVTMAGLEDMNLDSILDVLPAGLIRDMRDLQVWRSSCCSLKLSQADVDHGIYLCSPLKRKPSITIPSP